MKTTIIVEVFLLQVVNVCLSMILRLSCKTYGDFKIVLNNFSDPAEVIKTISVKQKRECVLECISSGSCKAVNFEGATGKCELVGRGLTSSLVVRSGWTYLTTDEKEANIGPTCKLLSPCQNGGLCMDTCSAPGFQCHCSRLHQGTFCEKPKEFASCTAAYEAGFTSTGVYWLTNIGYHFCRMTSLGECSGGGWTLILKTLKELTTFNYDANYWTTYNKYNHAYTVAEGLLLGEEAKYEAYNKLAFTKVCLVFRIAGRYTFLQIDKTASSMLDVMNSGYQATTVGRTKWLSLVENNQMQTQCNKEGFSVDNLVRIGIIANNEDDCFTPDSYIGIGIHGRASTYCNYAFKPAGNAICIGTTDLFNKLANAYLFVK
ncbi:uncharacterized protein LOC135685341 [Rhopilema esculentum]|uniref:uncharacterized protein LOC135685341 n=1 Tax=Rhopilema esculentum TaxID=499914 RepID=UPI0031DBA554